MENDENNCWEERTFCKSCNNEKRRKHNEKCSSENELRASHQQLKIDDVNINNRMLIKEFSTSDKINLMKYILLQKQELIYIITESVKQYPNIKTQTSDKIQPLEIYDNSTVVFHDMLLWKQASKIDLLFTRERHKNFGKYYISQS